MKRIMLLIALACAVGTAGAASVNWKSGKLYKAANASGTFASSGYAAVHGYLWIISDYATYAALVSDTSKISANVWAAYGSKTSSATKDSTTLSMGNMTLNDGVTYGGTETLYGAVIYKYTDATYGDMYIANAGTITLKDDSTVAVNNLAHYLLGDSTGTEITGWTPSATPSPEPTSGLLLLVGVAGLALRRRRA